MEQDNTVAKDKEEARTNTGAEKTNKQKKKAVPPVTENELQKLAKDFIEKCDPSTVMISACTTRTNA